MTRSLNVLLKISLTDPLLRPMNVSSEVVASVVSAFSPSRSNFPTSILTMLSLIDLTELLLKEKFDEVDNGLLNIVIDSASKLVMNSSNVMSSVPLFKSRLNDTTRGASASGMNTRACCAEPSLIATDALPLISSTRPPVMVMKVLLIVVARLVDVLSSLASKPDNCIFMTAPLSLVTVLVVSGCVIVPVCSS